MIERIRLVFSKVLEWSRGLKIVTVRDIFFFVVGFAIASYCALRLYEWYMENVIVLKGFVFKGLPYVVQLRP